MKRLTSNLAFIILQSRVLGFFESWGKFFKNRGGKKRWNNKLIKIKSNRFFISKMLIYSISCNLALSFKATSPIFITKPFCLKELKSIILVIMINFPPLAFSCRCYGPFSSDFSKPYQMNNVFCIPQQRKNNFSKVFFSFYISFSH